MWNQFKSALSILLLTLFLHFGGCGGGGSSGDGAGAGSGTPSAAATLPAVLSTTPTNGASLGNDNAVTVTFSKEMDPASLNSTTFKVKGVAGMVTSSGKTASFTPTDDLTPLTTYTATLSKEIKDTSGKNLESEYSWSFATVEEPDPSSGFVSPSTLIFTALPDGPLPPSQSLTISSSDGKKNWAMTTDTAWLASTPPSGIGPEAVAISVKTTHFAPGTYTGTITLILAEAPEAPQKVTVSYIVTSLTHSVTCLGPARPPYLAFDTATSATIAWECAPQGAVEWGAGSTFDHRMENLAAGNKHFVTLSDLTPSTLYGYRVTVNGEVFGTGTFQTAGAAGENHFNFVVFGDSGTGSPAQLALASLMEKLDFSFAIIAGDVIYDSGAESEFDSHYFIPYHKLINHLPFFPVAGNHDVRIDNGATFMSDFYHPTGKLYYEFHWGDSHFIALDSTHLDNPDQRAWLEKTLSSSTSLWKIIYFHHPVYSSGFYGGYRYIQDHYVPLFEKYTVDLVFTGHDHDYERTQPINGITYVVTGGGGTDLRPVGKSTFTAFSQSIHHIIKAQMIDHTLILSAVDSAGSAFDSVTLRK
jgi:hypothetical protein